MSGRPTGIGFREVAAAGDQTCAIRSNGSVQCWGNLAAAGWRNPPAESFVSIDADTWSICGIAANGGLYCWGTQVLRLPGGSFTAVDVGVYDSCALEPSGAARCFSAAGGNQYGASSNVPNAHFLDVAAGYHHACGVTDDHRLTCWGRNRWGEGTSPDGLLPCNPDAEVDWEIGYTY